MLHALSWYLQLACRYVIQHDSLRQLTIVLTAFLMLAACDSSGRPPMPKPRVPGVDAVDHLCNRLLAEQQGPKGQLYLNNEPEPLWFNSVREALAYRLVTKQKVNALYVTVIDSSVEFDLKHPERLGNTWLAADWALYVIASERLNQAGLAEAFPFREVAEASLFAELYDGKVVRLSDIPEEYLLVGRASLEALGQCEPVNR